MPGGFAHRLAIEAHDDGLAAITAVVLGAHSPPLRASGFRRIGSYQYGASQD
jgi:hypothetical protein